MAFYISKTRLSSEQHMKLLQASRSKFRNEQLSSTVKQNNPDVWLSGEKRRTQSNLIQMDETI